MPRYAVIIFYANDNVDEEASIFRAAYIDGQVEYVRREGQRRLPGPAFARLDPLYREAQALAEAQRDQTNDSQAPDGAGGAKPQGRFAKATKYFALPNIRALARQAWLHATGPALPWSSQLAVDTLLRQCKSPGCKPVFAYIPNSEFWRPDPRANDYRIALGDYIKLRDPTARLIDTSAEISRHGPAAYASQGGHLSALGYSVVADAIARSIQP